jgi:hypothetical protein
MLGEEVKDSEIVTKMLRSLPPHFKQITIAIKTLLDVSTMSVADLIGQLKEVEEAFEEAPTSLQRAGELYLTEDERTHGGKSAGWRTTLATVQAKVVGVAGVVGTAALHQVAHHQAGPLAMSASAAAS